MYNSKTIAKNALILPAQGRGTENRREVSSPAAGAIGRCCNQFRSFRVQKKRSLNKLGLRVMYMYAIGIRECARQKGTRFRRLLLVTMS